VSTEKKTDAIDAIDAVDVMAASDPLKMASILYPEGISATLSF
jgi:hypothetical protein